MDEETRFPKGRIEPIDINIPYPLEDFLEDVDGVNKCLSDNVFELPPPITIVDEKNRTAETIRLNAGNPVVLRELKMTRHFCERYGTGNWKKQRIVISRGMRFRAVMRFIGKWHDLLAEKGLVIAKKNDLARVSIAFLWFLLKFPINERSGVIPKTAMGDFFKEFQKI